jgi:uncharacterized protein YbcI
MATTPEHRERDPDQSQSLLLQISNAMVRMQKEFFGKGPTKAKSYMFDDLLLVIMREGLTTAEKTMLEFGHPNQVRQFRQLFQDEMTERLTGMVQDLTGRKVVNYQSQVLFDPDMSMEIFVFDSERPGGGIDVTSLAQLDDAEEPGAEPGAADDPMLEPPATAGQS